MATELKPCPFCGTHENDKNKAGWNQIAIIQSKYNCFQVHCRVCGASTASHDTKKAAKTAWNKRRDENKKEAWKEIILALADGPITMRPAAEKTFKSWTSIKYQVDAIKEETGKDPRNFYDLYDLVQMFKEDD